MASEWIIIVDDDKESLINTRELLRDLDLRVSTAKSGKDLLNFVDHHIPDLILLDIMMPEMDGFETYRQLRAYEAKAGRRPTPVIFLTGENDTKTERRGLTMGASDFVRKPCNRDILIRRIKNAIQYSKTIESLTEEAIQDKLTGFLNKAGANAKMTELCKTSQGMLMILDLDSFKLVNDIYGHEMGDRVLQAFAEVTKKNTRADDVLCRIGGDEFLVFCKGDLSESTVQGLAKRLNEQFFARCEEMMGKDFGIPIGVSVGAVKVPDHGTDYQQLFPLADKALYQVKQNGKHGFALFGTTMIVTEKISPEQEMHRLSTLLGERGEPKGALWLSQEAFTGAFRYALRSYLESGRTVSKVVFTLSSAEDAKEDRLPEVTGVFADVLNESLSLGDAVWQVKPSEYFVLLQGKAKEAAEALAEQVIRAWKEKTGIEDVQAEFLIEEF